MVGSDASAAPPINTSTCVDAAQIRRWVSHLDLHHLMPEQQLQWVDCLLQWLALARMKSNVRTDRLRFRMQVLLDERVNLSLDKIHKYQQDGNEAGIDIHVGTVRD